MLTHCQVTCVAGGPGASSPRRTQPGRGAQWSAQQPGMGARTPRGWAARRTAASAGSWPERLLRGDVGLAPAQGSGPASGPLGERGHRPAVLGEAQAEQELARGEPPRAQPPQTALHYCPPKSGSQSRPRHRYKPPGRLAFCTCPRRPGLPPRERPAWSSLRPLSVPCPS